MPELSHTVVFRAVRGAVKNALDGHPQWAVPKDFARSVAKRAAGTLAGMNPGIALAAARQSGKRRMSLPAGRLLRVRALLANEARALPAIKKIIDRRIIDAHKAGDAGRFLALCAVARIIKQEIAREQANAEAQTTARESQADARGCGGSGAYETVGQNGPSACEAAQGARSAVQQDVPKPGVWHSAARPVMP